MRTKLETDQCPCLTPVLAAEMESFLIDCRARNLAAGTIRRYAEILTDFAGYMAGIELETITPDDIRRFLSHLQDRGYKPGGVYTYYRTLKTFFRWLYAEDILMVDIFKRIKTPIVPDVIQPPISLADVGALLKVCRGNGFTAVRDKAVFLTLLDTGVRAAEFVAINLDDINLETGAIIIKEGKGRKYRTVFVTGRPLRAIIQYTRKIKVEKVPVPLWQSSEGTRLKYSGLRQIVRRRSELAEIQCPSLHAFRRAFAINSLRKKIDLITLQRLMGHSNLGVLYKYLAQISDDLREVHEETSPVSLLR